MIVFAIREYDDYGVYADWLEDHNLPSVAWRGRVAPPGFGAGWGDSDDYGGLGYGYGDGYGYGYGDGSGSGDGGSSDGYGDGEGCGEGYGDGYGFGGSGDGYVGTRLMKGDSMPVVGKRMLIFAGRGFAWIGDVVEQTGPFTFQLSDAYMLCRTGGVPWDVLVSGERRGEAVYRYWGDVWVGPEFGGSAVWRGDLPAEYVDGGNDGHTA